ncbi:MAG: transcriptional repressor [Planctomycetota bacterium]|nr:transcriptional repressor [Planctomycetota bacterium]
MSQKENTTDAVKKRIQSAGLRATPARLATMKALEDAEAPMTHAEVSAALQHLDIDKATIFRNLTDMAAANLVRRSELGDHVWRFEIIGESEQEHKSHPHFVCVDCGAVSCMEDIELTQKSKSVSQLVGQVTEILLRGHCNDCE